MDILHTITIINNDNNNAIELSRSACLELSKIASKDSLQLYFYGLYVTTKNNDRIIYMDSDIYNIIIHEIHSQ